MEAALSPHTTFISAAIGAIFESVIWQPAAGAGGLIMSIGTRPRSCFES
jgi:hypothetical protein